MMRKLFPAVAAMAVVATIRLAAQGMDDPNNKVAGGGLPRVGTAAPTSTAAATRPRRSPR